MTKNGTKNQFGEFKYTHSIKINHIRVLVPARNPGIITSPKSQTVMSQTVSIKPVLRDYAYEETRETSG